MQLYIRYLLALLLAIMLSGGPLLAQQDIQLLVENFNSVNPINFTLNDTVGPNIGSNLWIINNQYTGQPTYPNTISQDSTTIGSINNAPFSKYLHIYDSTTATVSNANFKPTVASNRFVSLTNGVCTRALTNVKVVFFYLAEGDTVNANPNAYGEMYYSIDGGTWISTGTKYYNQKKWKYEQVSLPDFNDVNNLRIGFRWVNNGTAQDLTTSFAIDDVQIVGTYDEVNNPVTIDILDINPDSVCPLNPVTMTIQISSPLCDGTYEIILSNSNGNFNNGTSSLGVFNLPNGLTLLTINTLDIPVVPYRSCYRFRVDRRAPLPVISGTVSACFSIYQCPNVIVIQPPVLVTTDPDTLCSLSAIDMKFNSYGVFSSGGPGGVNKYVAELSDSNGDFTNPQFIGELTSSTTYDNPAMPGSVSGLVPSTPAGCNYYIRIRSTNPTAVSGLYGPFCIKHCDMLTNNQQDIQACINELVGYDTTITLTINYWDSIARYGNGNLFQVQLLSMMDLSVVNTGGLSAVYDTVSRTMVLSIPPLGGLSALGIAPGSYYMRIISDSSSVTTNQNGTLVRLTIGAPSAYPPVITVSDSLVCNSPGTPPILFTVNPFNPDSEYEWTSSGFLGSPLTQDAVLLDVVGGIPNNYAVYVREINYGCYGPYSDRANYYFITKPTQGITGPPVVCQYDTVLFEVPLILETYYDWNGSEGNTVAASNNQLLTSFDSTGTFTLRNFGLNECGSATFTRDVEVISHLTVDGGWDTTVCEGEPVVLFASVGVDHRSIATPDTLRSPTSGFMYDITAQNDIYIDSLTVNLLNTTPIDVSVYYKSGSYVGFETDATAWTFWGSGFIQPPLTSNSTVPVLIGLPLNAGDTMAFYIHVANSNTNKLLYSNLPTVTDPVAADGNISLHAGAIMAGLFAGPLAPIAWQGGVHYTPTDGWNYVWSTGDTTELLTLYPEQTENIVITVDNPAGCGSKDEILITVIDGPDADAGTDGSICLGGEYSASIVADGSITWTPTTGISNPNSANPMFKPTETTTYYMQVSNPAYTCVGKDTLAIEVAIEQTEDDSADLCINQELLLQMPELPGSNYLWNTGATSPSLSINQPGTYTCQYQPGGTGCVILYTFNVDDYDCEDLIKVPAAFTPNNDGNNDFFTVFGENITDYTIKIYNRWGELVYESGDAGELNDFGRGWDGRHKGALQNFGTFVYYIEAQDVNGFKVEKQGHLTLIR